MDAFAWKDCRESFLSNNAPSDDVKRVTKKYGSIEMFFQRTARQNRENFARNSSVADANFARERRQTHNFFDTKHATDPSKHSADVVSLSQRRRPKFGCAQHQKRNRFASCLQPIRNFSNGKICTNSAPSARFCNAKRCTDSSESFVTRPTSHAAHDRQIKCMLSAPRAKIY